MKKTIKKLLLLEGKTGKQFAEEIGSNASQVSLYLNGSASLNHEQLEKAMKVTGINLEPISRRVDACHEIAKTLQEKGYSLADVRDMSREAMIECTGCCDLRYLMDVSEEEFDQLSNNGLVDYQGTYQYFKAMVIKVMATPASQSQKSKTKAFGALTVLGGGLAAVLFPTILGIAAAALGGVLGSSESTAKVSDPFFEITKHLFNKK